MTPLNTPEIAAETALKSHGLTDAHLQKLATLPSLDWAGLEALAREYAEKAAGGTSVFLSKLVGVLFPTRP